MSMIDTLKSSELFENLETRLIEKVAPLCRGMGYKEGDIIFKEGAEAAEMYILTGGRVALEMDVRPVPDRPAIPTAVEVVSKGEAFGWSALVEPRVYTLSARCMAPCTVLAINGDLLRKVIAEDAGLCFAVMSRIARLIALRLAYTRLRLVSGLGLILLGRELGKSG